MNKSIETKQELLTQPFSQHPFFVRITSMLVVLSNNCATSISDVFSHYPSVQKRIAWQTLYYAEVSSYHYLFQQISRIPQVLFAIKRIPQNSCRELNEPCPEPKYCYRGWPPGFLDTGYLSVDFKDVVVRFICQTSHFLIDICEVTGDFNELFYCLNFLGRLALLLPDTSAYFELPP